MIISVRWGIRLFFLIGPAFVIFASILPIKLIEYYKKENYAVITVSSVLVLAAFILISLIKSAKLSFLFFIPLIALIVLLTSFKQKWNDILLFCAFYSVSFILIVNFASYASSSYGEAKQTIPGVYEKQWYDAMTWIKENTPEKSIFAHWWDYGYWLQSLGNRPTIVDGGHPVSFWNYLMGRDVLTAQNETEALEFLYSHNASYLLIDSTDIGKYPAYSSIGSDENYDRLGSIGNFWIDDNSTKETKNKTLYVYVGGWGLDEDFIWNNQLYPAGKAVVAAVVLPLRNNSNNDGSIEQPNAIVIYQGKQTEIPIKKVYFKGKEYAFEEGLENELYIIPQVSEKGFNEMGGALYIGERGLKALWTKLYLFNESENFGLVHAEDHPILDSLRTTYHLNIGDFLMYGSNVLGPIKIWEIEYPANFTVEETKMKRYLQKESDLPFALW